MDEALCFGHLEVADLLVKKGGVRGQDSRKSGKSS